MPVNVVIAEDSAFQRRLISEMLSSHQSIDVIDVARNGFEAVEKVETHHPDVLVLDIVMPQMDGLTAFKQIMAKYPIPTIIFSVLDPQSLDKSVQALLMGAFDYIMKPGGEWKIELPKFKHQLIEKVLLASRSQIKQVYRKKNGEKTINLNGFPQHSERSLKKKSMRKNFPKLQSVTLSQLNSNLIVMGASVGGPKTIKNILSYLPKNISSPILIVQHINEHFIEHYVHSLSFSCEIEVKIGEDGEEILPGVAYFAPGERHMEIFIKNNKPCIKISNGEPVNFCKPSIDVLFFSAAQIYKQATLGILLTGMGEDGVLGLNAIKDFGGTTITESKETCILYGMPKVAAERGVADFILPNYDIPDQIKFFSNSFIKS